MLAAWLFLATRVFRVVIGGAAYFLGAAYRRSLWVVIPASAFAAVLVVIAACSSLMVWWKAPPRISTSSKVTPASANLHFLCGIYSLSDRLDPSNPPTLLYNLLGLDISKPPFADGGITAHIGSTRGDKVKDAVFDQLQRLLKQDDSRPRGWGTRWNGNKNNGGIEDRDSYSKLWVGAAHVLTDPNLRAIYLERAVPVLDDGWVGVEGPAEVRRRRVNKLRVVCGEFWQENEAMG